MSANEAGIYKSANVCNMYKRCYRYSYFTAIHDIDIRAYTFRVSDITTLCLRRYRFGWSSGLEIKGVVQFSKVYSSERQKQK